MNDDSILGNTLGQLGGVIKQTAQQAVKIPVDLVGDAGEQIGTMPETAAASSDSAGGTANQKPQDSKAGFQTDEDRIAFLKSLYGPSDDLGSKDSSLAPVKKAQQPNQAQIIKDEDFEKQIADKTPEEQQKLRALRKQLHDQYYQQLVNPPKQQEERPAEKVEKEKKIEMADLQKKQEEKPPPLAVVREQNKAEMFRGAAG